MKRIYSLIEKTGEKVIFIDPETETPYVLMDLDSYEQLISYPKEVNYPQNTQEKVDEEVKEWKAVATGLLGGGIEDVEIVETSLPAGKKARETEAEEGLESQLIAEQSNLVETELEETGKNLHIEEVG